MNGVCDWWNFKNTQNWMSFIETFARTQQQQQQQQQQWRQLGLGLGINFHND
jgi:hypothetical protein